MTSDYLGELFEQPEALRRAVGEFPSGGGEALERMNRRLESGAFDNVILTGMGASLHGCYPLWLTLVNSLSVPSVVWDASELIHFAPGAITDRTLLIAVSQSGESAELRRLGDLGQRPGMAISITNGDDNSLARWADLPLFTHAGNELSVSNKTYVTGLAVLHLLGCRLTGRDVDGARDALLGIASALERLLEGMEDRINEAVRPFADTGCLAFIGRGYGLASARAGSLITQEASKLPCVAYSGGEFRHGPLELARPGFSAVIFAGSGEAGALNRRLAGEIRGSGGHVLLISSDAADATAGEGMPVIALPEAEPALSQILEIVPVQFLTIPLALARGHEPATFERASKITAVE